MIYDDNEKMLPSVYSAVYNNKQCLLQSYNILFIINFNFHLSIVP